MIDTSCDSFRELEYRRLKETERYRVVEVNSETPLTVLVNNKPVKLANKYMMKIKYSRGDTNATVFNIRQHNNVYRALCP